MDFSIHRYLVGLLGWGISPTQAKLIIMKINMERKQLKSHPEDRGNIGCGRETDYYKNNN
jgi:hypothetical protein